VDARLLTPADLDALIQRLAGDREVIGPVRRDGAIVLDELRGARDLPAGWTDQQGPAEYRLVETGDDARFAWRVGPHAARRYLQPPRQRLFRTEGRGRALKIVDQAPAPRPRALFGLRACDVAAIGVQDRVLRDDDPADPHYAAERAGALVVAAHCTSAADTCFCASMNTGPRAASFDLALTELDPARYLLEVGTEAGAAYVDDAWPAPTDADHAEAARLIDGCARSMTRAVDPERARVALAETWESPRYDEIASRCLSCANCTLVCPTCFCTTVVDKTSLDGESTTRDREWDSCFHERHSYMHGGAVRQTTRARYRQWLTHKFSSWFDQFGESGCTGCGRCITWCPSAIDHVAEANAFIVEAGGSS
jgi:ferredoxin